MKFGSAFSENVKYDQGKRKLFSVSTSSWWAGVGRPLLFASLTAIVFSVLIFRLFSLTVVEGHRYRQLGDTNRTKQLVIHAPRGRLLDRTGKPLADNVRYYRLLKPCDDAPDKLCVKRLSIEEGDALRDAGLPDSQFLETDFRRDYPADKAVSQAIGYVNELTAEELADEYYALRGYSRGDLIGRTGAEAVYEELLRGKDGREFVEVDAKGKVLRTLGKTPEIPGTDVMLTVDKDLSESAARAFPSGQKGAVVVSKPSTGEILALYSGPAFSSRDLSGGMDEQSYQAFIADPDRPLFDRAIGGVYPPGSIFKLVTSVAGLEEGAVKKDTTVEDTGEIKIGDFTFPNWYFKQYGKTEGMVTIAKAIQRSNDIFFYKVGEWVGITKLGAWATKMGVGTILGIELPGEAKGLMPDPAWKNSAFHTEADLAAKNNEWYLGDTYHVAIGQGYLLTTPLQANTWTNVVANGGKLCRPSIRKSDIGSRISDTCKDIGIHKETVAVITEGMRKACEPGGTGYPLFNFIVPVACKTGTAEFGLSAGPGTGSLKTHAWFTAFAPFPSDKDSGNQSVDSRNQTISGDPELSVTVLIEGAGEGSDKAAPVAKKILEEWFSR